MFNVYIWHCVPARIIFKLKTRFGRDFGLMYTKIMFLLKKRVCRGAERYNSKTLNLCPLLKQIYWNLENYTCTDVKKCVNFCNSNFQIWLLNYIKHCFSDVASCRLRPQPTGASCRFVTHVFVDGAIVDILGPEDVETLPPIHW